MLVPCAALLALLGVMSPVDALPEPVAWPGILVTTRWVAENLSGVTIVDVRDASKYEAGHLPGAVNVKWRLFSDPAAPYPGNVNPDPRKLAQLLSAAGIGSSRPVVVYADPLGSWGEEGRMFWMLELLGHRQVAIMDGGWPRWRAEGRPHESGTAPPRPARFDATWDPSRIIGWQEIHRRLGDPTLRIVDTRTREEYDGATPYGEARGGRIPGAVHLHWLDLLDDSGMLRTRTQIDALLKARGISPDREIAMYCTGGVRSGFVYHVLRHLGFARARNYDGSFWEWAGRPELPVAHGAEGAAAPAGTVTPRR
jgi:thiosulfate/3-mercaptopyruvate sulfurtransferase